MNHSSLLGFQLDLLQKAKLRQLFSSLYTFSIFPSIPFDRDLEHHCQARRRSGGERRRLFLSKVNSSFRSSSSSYPRRLRRTQPANAFPLPPSSSFIVYYYNRQGQVKAFISCCFSPPRGGGEGERDSPSAPTVRPPQRPYPCIQTKLAPRPMSVRSARECRTFISPLFLDDASKECIRWRSYWPHAAVGMRSKGG